MSILVFAIILMGKRELVALLSFCLLVSCDGCLALPRAAPWVCLRFVNVVIPDHAQLLFLSTLKE